MSKRKALLLWTKYVPLGIHMGTEATGRYCSQGLRVGTALSSESGKGSWAPRLLCLGSQPKWGFGLLTQFVQSSVLHCI